MFYIHFPRCWFDTATIYKENDNLKLFALTWGFYVVLTLDQKSWNDFRTFPIVNAHAAAWLYK